MVKEVFGVRDSVNNGYMHWNNAGNYDMLSPDVGATDAFIGTCVEASDKFRKPALGKAQAPEYKDEGITWMDRIYQHGEYGPDRGAMETVYTPLLHINLVNTK